jgi:hypothetical protein
VAVAAGLLAIGGVAAPASAAPAKRVVPVAGTGHYLVYGEYAPVASGRVDVALYSLDSRGRTRSLGSIATSTPTSIPATAAGSVLVVPKDATANDRWDLRTGARTTIPSNTVAAPGGYAAVGDNGRTGADARQTVVLVTDSGSTSIGVPFPRNENTDGTFRLSSGSAGVTITDGNGHVRFIAFAAPGKVRSLTTIDRGASIASLSCSAFTARSVACSAFDEETTTLLGLRLDGSRVLRATPNCVGTPAALRTGIAWIGCRNRLSVLDASGKVRTSAVTFGTARPVTAFGEVVVQSRTGRALQAMTRAGSTPMTIVTAR